MQPQSIHGMWSSRFAFVLAATGSAVGLGNIWRFPYVTSDNGGGAFVLVYLGCIVLVGLPLMLSEILVGRRGRMSPINAIRYVAGETGASKWWMGIGALGIVAAILFLSFYSVIGGWTLHYASHYLIDLFGGTGITDPGATYEAMLGSARTLTLWHAIFMLLTVGVVAFGVEKGLERAVRILMPLLLLLLLILLGYSMTTGAFGQAMSFLFTPDFSRLNAGMVLTALGQAFFTLSLGMCAIMTYGAYLPADADIPKVGATVAAADTGVALLAGMAIFPVVIAFGLSPEGGGPGLIFTSLPLAFADMSFGILYGLMFFGLLSVAAWTSSISLLEPPTAYLVEATNLTRKKAAFLVAFLVWVLGLASVLSFNVLSDFLIGGLNMQELVEYVAADLMLPIGGFFTAIFAGWIVSKTITREELGKRFPAWAYTLWLWLARVVTPVLILMVFAGILGVF